METSSTGRNASCDCAILVQTCSKLHAQIDVEPDAPYQVRPSHPGCPAPSHACRGNTSRGELTVLVCRLL